LVSTIRRALWIATVNVALTLLLFGLIELAYRFHVVGVRPTMEALLAFTKAPFSDLGDSQWVVFDAELGYRLNPRIDGFNSRSVRGDEITVPKPEKRHRIIYLGDSVPFDNPGLVSITRDSLRQLGDVEVINAGIPGYTSYQEVLFFEKYLLDTSPDVVVWTYCLNDNHRFLHRFDRDGRMLLTNEARARLALDPPWDAIVRRSYVLSRIHVGLAGLGRPRQDSEFEWEARADFSIAWKDYSWVEYEENFQRMVHLTRQHGIKLVVVIVPFEPQLFHALTLEGQPERLGYVTRPQRSVIAVAEKYGVPYLDLLPAYLPEYARGGRFFRDGIHLNPEGHAYTARRVLRFMSETDLLP
jgi:lysophospholipase L1-like esterase